MNKPKHKYPHAHAHEQARLNAIKTLGLREHNTAEDRARALGFDLNENLYHGTNSDFPAFEKHPRYGAGTYATEDPEIADIYAESERREGNAHPNVLPIVARGKKLTVSDLHPEDPHTGGWFRDNMAKATAIPKIRRMEEQLPKHGYDRLQINDMSDLGGLQTQHMFPDPSVIRSRFAAFDPHRVHENNLLAAKGGKVPSIAQMKVHLGGKELPVTMHPIEQREGNQLVNIKPEAFDKAFQKTDWQYVGKEGKGGIEGRYKRFGDFVKEAPSMRASNVAVNKNGSVVFGDGRHRYAYLRDQGLESIPMSMDKESIEHASKHGYLHKAEGGSMEDPLSPKQRALQMMKQQQMAKGGVISLLRKHGQPVNSHMDAMKRQSNGHHVYAFHEQDETPREIKSMHELQGYTPEQIYTIHPQHLVEHKADGGSARDKALQKYLAESQVKHPVYHVAKTDVKEFSPKNRTELSSMGHHFGTAEQANFRMGQYDFESKHPNIGKYHLNIKKPLEVSHMGSFAPDHLAEQMMDMGILDPDKYDAMSEKHSYSSLPLGNELVKILKKHGYDGLMYANEREGEGHSYVPFEPHQVKSAIGNRGTYDINESDINKAKGGLAHMAEGGSNDDYRGSHQAPGPHFGAPMHDVSGNGMYPEDFYGSNGARYYADINDPIDRETHRQVLSVRGKPDAMVTIHRAIPTYVHEAAMKTEDPIKHMIRHGDWVTIHKGYAKIHGEGPLKGKYKIASMRVPAKHVWTNADSIHEWGYHPDKVTHKADGGHVQGKPMNTPTLAQMRHSINTHGNPEIMDNIGINEAMDMDPKIFVSPNPHDTGVPATGGVADSHGLPIGGVDTNNMQPGQQLNPQPMGQQQQPGQPPAPGGAPGGMPSGPTPPEGNMLSMTPQGQTMQAMQPQGQPPQGLAEGGQPKRMFKIQSAGHQEKRKEPEFTPYEPKDISIKKLARAFDEAIAHHRSLPNEERIMNSFNAAQKLGKIIGVNPNGMTKDLLGKNAKLLKTEQGKVEELKLPDGRGVETTGLALAPSYEEEGFTTCPNSASCKKECLGKTSGNYHKLGGGADLSEFKGPRLNSLKKTQAFLHDPHSFAVRLHDEIQAAKEMAGANNNHLGVRLNVLSDINPRVYKSIIEAHPDVTFYDYTKNNTNPIAPNHHYTYSSTGVSQEGVENPNTNWKQMRKRLQGGDNVAMAFSHKGHIPETVHDEETGQKFRVINGDTHDFRPMDLQPEGKHGVIVGLKNKKATGRMNEAHIDSQGFFVHHDPKEKVVLNKSGKPIFARDAKGKTIAQNKEVRIKPQYDELKLATNDDGDKV